MPRDRSTPSDEYFAGLTDGEGWVSLIQPWGHNRKVRPIVDVQMTHQATIETLHRRFGGNLLQRKPASDRHKMVWRWRVVGQTAKLCILAIRPFVITKRDDVEEVIRFLRETGEIG